MQVDADEDHEDRGRLHPHELPFVLMAAVATRQQLALATGRRRRHAAHYREVFELEQREQQLMGLLMLHYMSYDKVWMPPIVQAAGPMLEPWIELNEADFFRCTHWDKRNWLEAVDALTLFPDPFVTAGGCKVSRRLAMYTLLRRWSVMDTLDVQARHQRTSRPRLSDIINSTIARLMDESTGYQRLITHFDFDRIQPLLQEYCDAVRDAAPGGTPNIGAWIDGKPWLYRKPGYGSTAHKVAAATGANIDDVQRAFYNRNYKGHGVKVQSIVFPDGIKYDFCFSLRRHDAYVYERSPVPSMCCRPVGGPFFPAFAQIINAG